MTPIECNLNFYKNLGVDLYIKRDDLYPISGGGNKGRKAKYILDKCILDGCNAVVTCGGIQSNHTRATAIRCKELGLECTIIIHAKPKEKSSGNLKLLELLGVRIVYCDIGDVSTVMDAEMLRWSSLGYSPFYIWGGGHCNEGTLAYFDAVKELKEQTDITFDAVFVASGTGATQAGLHCGFRRYFPDCQVYGISVARDQQRGYDAVEKSVAEFIEYKGLNNNYLNEIKFDDSFVCGGYEKTTSELTDLIKSVAEATGIILDPTYTGKAWLGMEDHVKHKGLGPSKTVLFWHTGGLLNLMA
ncbi:pyridoxal-phosphate dependent enzyme [Vibrio satsumensis]|uniref:1-aminocyclopropane-1-carboxylate deaminase/D-cysteine desulfhydrase n=1 Tax=Vibrio satsumensis TaxID=2910245 RepID=UPI003D0B9D1D